MNDIAIDIKSKIYNVCGKQVMLDRDLAELYEVESKRLNEQVRRNIDRFPPEFMFRLTKEEYEILRSQIATLRLEKGWGTHSKYLPYVFTEQGVSMLSAVLKSKKAIEVSIKIINSFIAMRKFLSQNSLIFQKFEQIDKKLLYHDENFNKIFKALENKTAIKEQGIFYNGQIFDAHKFVSDLIRSAKKSIVLIDNYIDDTTLTLLSKNQKVDITIYTHTISKILSQDVKKYNSQYKPFSLKTTKNFHDRFLVIDENDVYHVGASLKDLGKKVFGFSKMKGFDMGMLGLY